MSLLEAAEEASAHPQTLGNEKKWWEVVSVFAVRVITGASIFALLVFAAIGLHLLSHWLVRLNMPTLFTITTTTLEYMLFLGDGVLFVIFLLREFIKGAQIFWRGI